MLEEKLLEQLSINKQFIWIKGSYEKKIMIDIINALSKFNIDRIFTWNCLSNTEEIIVENNNFKQLPLNKELNKPLHIFYNMLQKGCSVLESADSYALILKDYDLLSESREHIRLIREIAGKNDDKFIPIIVTSDKFNPPMKLKNLFQVIQDENPLENDIFELLAQYENNRDITINLNKEILSKKLLGFNKVEIIELLDLSMYRYGKVELSVIEDKKIELIKNTDVLDLKKPVAILDEIGGNENFKKWFEEAKLCMTPEAIEYGVDSPKGYLALGIPGCSKSLMAEAIANELNVPFLKLNMSKILSKFVGESEQKIEQAINLIESCAPCVLLIDEVEKNLGGYASSNASDSGTLSRVFSKILDMLVDNDKGIFTIMTSNNVKDLPPELTRAGRLDALWYFSLPNEEERKDIFNIHFNKRKQNLSKELIKYISKETKDYTGAEIEQIVKSSMKKAYVDKVKNNKSFKITKEILLEAKDSVIPVAKSSKEKVYALENYAKGRALYASKQTNKIDKITLDIDSIDIDELIN